MIRTSLKPVYDAEVISCESETVPGLALSIPELTKRLLLGTVDPKDVIRPAVFDDNPDIDNPSILNNFGVDRVDLDIELETTRDKLRRNSKRKNPISTPVNEEDGTKKEEDSPIDAAL